MKNVSSPGGHERECACDETVLRLGCLSADAYGESMLRVLTRLRGGSWATAGLVGVFERGAKFQERFEEIMNYKPRAYQSAWPRRLVLVAIAVVVLPMSPGDGHGPIALAEKPALSEAIDNTKSAQPRMVKCSPENGATEIDPALAEIAVTFDRDMDRGMSWTGGPPLFPPVDSTREVRWANSRTCVLPVKLQAGTYYRLGINSSNHRNFRDRGGIPAEVAAIYFVTKGASGDVKARVRVPKVVALKPQNGADDVDPATEALRVTFDVPMDEGMSWTGGGKGFPKLQEGQAAKWSDDGLTCILPVSLEPGHQYTLGLNNVEHNNFQSRWGVPLEGVVYKFQTRGK